MEPQSGLGNLFLFSSTTILVEKHSDFAQLSANQVIMPRGFCVHVRMCALLNTC